jgi:hypothetical protein
MSKSKYFFWISSYWPSRGSPRSRREPLVEVAVLAHADAGPVAVMLRVGVGGADELVSLAGVGLEEAVVERDESAIVASMPPGGEVEIHLVLRAVEAQRSTRELRLHEVLVDGAALHADDLAGHALGRAVEAGALGRDEAGRASGSTWPKSR